MGKQYGPCPFGYARAIRGPFNSFQFCRGDASPNHAAFRLAFRELGATYFRLFFSWHKIVVDAQSFLWHKKSKQSL